MASMKRIARQKDGDCVCPDMDLRPKHHEPCSELANVSFLFCSMRYNKAYMRAVQSRLGCFNGESISEHSNQITSDSQTAQGIRGKKCDI